MKAAEYLDGMATLFNKPMNAVSARMILDELNEFSEDEVLFALKKCVRELKYFPSVAEIISRIDDGRPSAEEAWALCPKTEYASVVWTPEIKSAYFVASSHLPNDPVAARMTFKEVYERELSFARAEKKKVKWEVSLGLDESGRKTALMNAVQKKRITEQQAISLLPSMDLQTEIHNDIKKLVSTSLNALENKNAER